MMDLFAYESIHFCSVLCASRFFLFDVMRESATAMTDIAVIIPIEIF